MKKFKFVVILLVFYFFNKCVANDSGNFCETNTRLRRSVPYIISIGDCDPSKIKIIRTDDIQEKGERKVEEKNEEKEDAVQAVASNVAEKALKRRKTLYDFLTKVLERVQARADKAVEKARATVERRRAAVSRSKRNQDD